jgi:hypothetical protein
MSITIKEEYAMRTILKVGNGSRYMLMGAVVLAGMMTGLPQAGAVDSIEEAKTVTGEALSTFNNFRQDPASASILRKQRDS